MSNMSYKAVFKEWGACTSSTGMHTCEIGYTEKHMLQGLLRLQAYIGAGGSWGSGAAGGARGWV